MFRNTKAVLAAAAVTGLVASVVAHASSWGAPPPGPVPVLDGPPPPARMMGARLGMDEQVAIGPGPRRGFFGGHVEGRIAFLKAELKITPAEETAWDQVAATMRANAAVFTRLRESMKPAWEQAKDHPPSAAQLVEWHANIAQARAKAAIAFASAFKPLYDQLSDDQRKAADSLFAPHRFRHG